MILPLSIEQFMKSNTEKCNKSKLDLGNGQKEMGGGVMTNIDLNFGTKSGN